MNLGPILDVLFTSTFILYYCKKLLTQKIFTFYAFLKWRQKKGKSEPGKSFFSFLKKWSDKNVYKIFLKLLPLLLLLLFLS